MPRPKLILLAVLLTLAMVACGGTGGAPPITPTFTSAPATTPPPQSNSTEAASTDAPTQAAATEPASEAGYPKLDPCTLVTAEEAAVILEGEVSRDPFGLDAEFGGCQHNTEGQARILFVAAAYGEEAKLLIVAAIGLAAQMSEDQALKDYYADIRARSETMSVVEVFNEIYLSPPAELMAEDAIPYETVSGFGDSAVYQWDAEESEAEFNLVAGQKLVTLRLQGLPEATARPTLESLAEQVLSRLPEGFSTLNLSEE